MVWKLSRTFALTKQQVKLLTLKIMELIKVGTKVRHTSFSGVSYEGVVTCIELCENGSKYGRKVSTMPLGQEDRRFNITLDNGHWCYGYQVQSIIK